MNKFHVGRALLFKGEELFADCRTLADSSITIGVTAEDIRGGEGNKLWGQYFHDSQLSLKLTDIMFNMEYVAAQVGSGIVHAGDVFKTETLTAAGTTLTLSYPAVPIVSGGKTYIWIKPADGTGDQVRVEVVGEDTKNVSDSAIKDGVEYCVMYKYTDDAAKQITVNAQFIPAVLHAVLTVALYYGDACNVEAATKAGEVTIDIPRLQLNGALDLSMTATGASQTSLEGMALSTGCSGCDASGVYATITQVIFNTNWYDDCDGIILENAVRSVKPGRVNESFVAYAYYKDGAPKAINNADLTWNPVSEGGTALNVASGVVSGTGTTGTFSFKAYVTKKPELIAMGSVVVAD